MPMNSREVIILVFFPELWEMLLIAGYKVVGAGGIRALNEFVVVGVFRNPEQMRGGNYPRLILYKLDEFRAKTTPDLEFRTRQDIAIFREDGFGDVKPGWPGERKEEHGAPESLRFQSGRHEDVSIDDDAERDHRLQVIVLQTTVYRLHSPGC
jgi:hypothetical protein